MFLWCRARHINHVKINPRRIARTDKELVYDLDYDEIKFPVQKKVFSKMCVML